MSTTTRTADAVTRIMREHEPELHAAGITRLTLFGSVARGEDDAESDVDLLAALDPDHSGTRRPAPHVIPCPRQCIRGMTRSGACCRRSTTGGQE